MKLRQDMNVTFIIALVLLAVVVFVFAFKQMAFVSPEDAKRYLADGGLIIDVRSPGEFEAGHVRNAVNIPLGDLRASLPRHVKNQNQALLVYCLSGGRSEIARQQLIRLGYPNVFNLGSLSRAKTISDQEPSRQAPSP